MGAGSQQRKTELGSQAVTGLAAAAAAVVAGPAVGIAAAGAAPVASAVLQSAIERWNERRYEKVQRTLVQAGSQAKMTPEELVTTLASDPASLDLLIEALDAAARSGISEKLGALSDVLTRAATDEEGDGSTIERERVVVGILRDLEAPQVAVLGYLLEDPERPGHRRLARRSALGHVAGAAPIEHTLAVLQRHGLVREVTPDELATWADSRQALAHAGISATTRGPDNVAWMLTGLGAECLEMLQTHPRADSA